MNLSADQILDACEGQYLVPPLDSTIYSTAVKIDSRKINAGDLFIAMKGEKVDGHDYINDAIYDKASIIVCEKDVNDATKKLANDYATTIIKVKDCKTALQNISLVWRNNLMAKVIGITGSAGKTTTKNLLLEALKVVHKVSANDGNYNNDLGLPITICKSNFDDDFVITEMGMNAPGEIANLCKMAQPIWGLITNIGDAHIEFFGSRENIAKAKSELALNLPDNLGVMFLPTDDDYRDFIIDYAKLNERNIKLVFFGGTKYHKDLDAPQVWYEDLEIDESGKSTFKVCIKGFWNSEIEKQECKLNLTGKYNVINCCGAIAVALYADVSLSKVIEQYKKIKPVAGRSELVKAKAGFSIINDAYNANPQSMKSAIDTLVSIKCNGKRIAFLGDMFELGDKEKIGHEEVGEYVSKCKIDYLICVGKMSKAICESAIKFNMDKDAVFHFIDAKEAKEKLLEIANPDDLVLIKASNGMKFLDIVKELAV